MIIFDLDDTLIDTTGSITPFQLERALRRMVAAGLEVGSFKTALATLQRMDLSSESASQTLREFLELVDGEHRFLSIGEAVVYGELPPDLPVFPLEDAGVVLEQLRQFHLLALVSIGKPPQQLFKLKKAGLDVSLFSHVDISETEEKGDAYHKILEEFSISPAKTVVCGDRISRDLKPAKQLGCQTVQIEWGRGYNAKGDAADVDFKIQKLIELYDIVER